MSDNNVEQGRILAALKQARAHVEAADRARHEAIAIVGIGCRLPGDADNAEAYWRLLVDGIDAVGEVPKNRWDNDAIFDPDRRAAGKTYTRRGAFIRLPDRFDAGFFGLSPREAAHLDPQQRLLLETAWEALEDAGLAGSTQGRRGAVYVGIGQSHYGDLQLNPEHLADIDTYAGTGSLLCFASGRLSHWLGLTGPSLSIDTACSSSLVATHLACQSLRNGEAELALVGGVHLNLAPHVSVFLSRAGVLAADGRSKAFDAAADGFGRGEGCAVLVLKRLSDALADGDAIHALIRGSAVDHDGAGAGLTVPNETAQANVVREALRNAKLTPAEVALVETHGTGTELGDPIEVRALAKVFADQHDEAKPLYLGAVKSAIGHLEAAAGLAGLIKAALAVKHGRIPLQSHFNQPNPHIPWAQLPFVVPRQTQPWPAAYPRRIAGVSAFGMSGCNVHVLLEAPPAAATAAEAEPFQRPSQLLLLSARSEAALHGLADSYRQHLQSHPEQPFADVCHSAAAGRAAFEHRLALVCQNGAEAAAALAAFAVGTQAAGIATGLAGNNRDAIKPVFLFTGQGSQYWNMGRELYRTQPQFKAALDRCAALLEPLLEKPLLTVLYGDETEAKLLNRTDFTQPALFSLQYALAELWRSWGVLPAAVLGHSLGEYAAACVAGVFSLEDGLRLVAERGRLMRALPDNGGMAALLCQDAEALAAWLADHGETVVVSGFNSPRELVVSGPRQALQALLPKLAERGASGHELAVSHAFHSPLMQPMLADFAAVARSVDYHSPQLDMLSSMDARWNDVANADYWCRQILQPVRFSQAMAELAGHDHTLFLEIGPRPILSALGKANLPAPNHFWLPSLNRGQNDWDCMLHSMAKLYCAGSAFDATGFDRGYACRKVALPTYPFQRSRHWLEPATHAAAASPAADLGRQALAGKRLALPGSSEIRYQVRLDPARMPALAEHKVFGAVVVAAAYHLAMVLQAAADAFGTQRLRLQDIRLPRALSMEDGAGLQAQVLLQAEADGSYRFQTLSCQDAADTHRQDSWQSHVSGKLYVNSTDLPAASSVSPALQLGEQSTELSGDEFYAPLAELGFGLGPGYRWLRQLEQQPGHLRGRLQAPSGLTAGFQGGVHPGLLDTCFQLLSRFWPSSPAQLLDSGSLYVPFAISALDLFALPPTDGADLICSANLPAMPNLDAELTPAADLRLQSQDGATLLTVAGFQFRRTGRAALLGAGQTNPEQLLALHWQASPPTASAPPAAGRRRWLLIADRAGLGSALAERLRAQGDDCLVRHDTAGLPPGADYAGVVYLRALDNQTSAATDPDSVQILLQQSVADMQALLGHLAAAPSAPRLWLVTRAAQPVVAGTDWRCLAQTPLWGLASTLAVEHANLKPVCIDLGPESATEDAALLQQALAEPAREDWIAYRNGQRYVARLQAYQPQPSAKAAIRADRSYLLTGGLGGLGLVLAKWLLDQGARHVLLCGRHPADSLAEAELARLHRPGAKLQYRQADIADAGQAAALFAHIDAEWPPLAGIVHSAGVLHDGLLLQQSPAALAEVFAPKIAGAWHLHRCCENRPLDFLVFFGSAATLVGSRGQAGYAMANSFMDALAQARRTSGLPALCLDWGAWDEVGMGARLAEPLRRRWTQRGFGHIQPQRGLELFGSLLGGQAAQLAVLAIDDPALLANAGPARWSGLQATVAETAAASATSVASDLAQAPVEQRPALLENVVRRIIADTLGIKAPDGIEPRGRLFDLGFDSMLALETAERLSKTLGIDLHDTLVFEYPTLEALLAYLTKQLNLSPATQTAVPAAATSSTPLSETDIAALSEDEAERLLLAQLQELSE